MTVSSYKAESNPNILKMQISPTTKASHCGGDTSMSSSLNGPRQGELHRRTLASTSGEGMF
ncbi:hypothetical protein E2C01_070516 [Portunus trituberculatus]|uniref:Uncharacterized protein n=1 Tax=Portunus trituberculatus TaxID=210409 RepID=A0A5B7HSX5_PORTR|nr:hypothetical protein [Portunus trituberculatus]